MTGENFRLTYTVNTQNASDFRMGKVPDALEIITGPYTSQQSSFQMVNGHTSSSSSITYTFIICANKNGTYTIPPAHVSAGGKDVQSQPVKITVSGTAQSTNGSPRMHDDHDDQPQLRSAGSHITGNDLFIKVSASKSRVHEQEPVLLTYKVYTLVELTYLEGNMPITFDGTVIQQNRDVDPFEAFFNGGSGYVEVKRSIKAPGLKLQVDPLPTRPSNFSGGVGRFNISAQINKKEVKANDPITIRVVVGGTGNLKLIKQPVIDFPKDFDKYDPKVTDKTKLTVNGVEGNMIYDFLAVPRNQGKYTIPAIEFVYFDANANAYKTLKTTPFELNVLKGDGNSGSSDFMTEMQNQDIHAIKTGKAEVKGVHDFFFGSFLYWFSIISLLALFVVLLVIFRKRALDRANISKMRGKKANKVAVKRLRFANKLMAEGKQNEFYDEVLKALWGYVGDKLNMPVEQLSKDNIAERLVEKKVDEETIDKFVSAIDECEFERYAPGDAAGNMNKTYDSAISAIMKIEDVMKDNKKANKTKEMLVLLALMMSVTSQAVTKQNADAEYAKGNYMQAIKDYEELLKSGASVDLYYNLGNAYYRTDNITRAVINYERALLLAPGDKDVRFNLQMARSKTIDKITPESEMFFVTWWRDLTRCMSIDGWMTLGIAAFVLMLAGLLMYMFLTPLTLRKCGFYGAVAMLVLTLLANLSALSQHTDQIHRSTAIIMAPSVAVKSSPSQTSTDLFLIHEGSKVEILDATMRDWMEVQFEEGKQGWVPVSALEVI